MKRIAACTSKAGFAAGFAGAAFWAVIGLARIWGSFGEWMTIPRTGEVSGLTHFAYAVATAAALYAGLRAGDALSFIDRASRSWKCGGAAFLATSIGAGFFRMASVLWTT